MLKWWTPQDVEAETEAGYYRLSPEEQLELDRAWMALRSGWDMGSTRRRWSDEELRRLDLLIEHERLLKAIVAVMPRANPSSARRL